MPNGRTPPDWVYFCAREARSQRPTSGSGTAPYATLNEQRRATDLLDAGDVARDVLDRDRVLDCQAVRLALDARTVDQDAGVGGQACCGGERGGQLGRARGARGGAEREEGAPAKPRQMWSSSMAVLRTVRGSCS